MLWLERPPFLRWLAATLVAAVAVALELSPPPTEEAAFLAVDVPAGTALDETMVTYRRLPVGALATVAPTGFAAVDLAAGDPLIASVVTDVSVPGQWVVLEAPLPAHARPGDRAIGVVVGPGAPPLEFPALVVAPAVADAFGAGLGTIAVPADWLSVSAGAVADGRLVIGVESASR